MDKPEFQTKLGWAINHMLQDDATGQVLALSRGQNGLECSVIQPETIFDDDIERFEVIIFDGGNTHGSSWKHVFFPQPMVSFFTTDEGSSTGTLP